MLNDTGYDKILSDVKRAIKKLLAVTNEVGRPGWFQWCQTTCGLSALTVDEVCDALSQVPGLRCEDGKILFRSDYDDYRISVREVGDYQTRETGSQSEIRFYLAK